MRNIKETLDLLLNLIELINVAEGNGDFQQQLLHQMLPMDKITEMLRFIDEDIMKTHALLNFLKSQKSKLEIAKDEESINNEKSLTSNVCCDVGVQVENFQMKDKDKMIPIEILSKETDEVTLLKLDEVKTSVDNRKKECIIADKMPKNVHFSKSRFKHLDTNLPTYSNDNNDKHEDDGQQSTNQTNIEKPAYKKLGKKKVFRSIATETIDLPQTSNSNHEIYNANEDDDLLKQSLQISFDETVYLKLPDQIRQPKEILKGNIAHLAKSKTKVNFKEDNLNDNLELEFALPSNEDNDFSFNSADNTQHFRTLSAIPMNTSTPKQTDRTTIDDISSLYQSVTFNNMNDNGNDNTNETFYDITNMNITEFNRTQFWQSVLQKAGLNKTTLLDN